MVATSPKQCISDTHQVETVGDDASGWSDTFPACCCVLIFKVA